MTLIEFETYALYASDRKKVYINPDEVASIEEGHYSDCTVVYMKDGRNHCITGYASQVASLVSAGGMV